MEDVLYGFLKRNLPGLEDRFEFDISPDMGEAFCLSWRGDRLFVRAGSKVNAVHGIYEYLKKYCCAQLSWCGNRELHITELPRFDGEFSRSWPQKYRVYMNYCTLDYSMCWWDFERWEKEIDFMAMNGINMPLAVVGCEAVWFETLLEFGFSEKEALSTISGPAFWAWQMMTNIEGYMPPESRDYVYERLVLGRKILKRYLEYDMHPIQQGFSGHVPVLMKKKFKKASIKLKASWCGFAKTAQLDPLDPLFQKMGAAYLANLKRLFGFYGFIACDPFHEGHPPKPQASYLAAVGRAIDKMYRDFEESSVWVMQAWTLREHIVKAVPKERLLLLDLNSKSTPAHSNMWGYPVVAGMLHDFGGKNPMQGKLEEHSKNIYLTLKNGGANVLGSGLFMEGIEQNPAVYDMQFELLTMPDALDLDEWLRDYIKRRYGHFSETLYRAWLMLLETCYKSEGYSENNVGSCLASRPQLMPAWTGLSCRVKKYYDFEKFEEAAALFCSAADEFSGSDGYQYDLCDILRQAMSNRFYTNEAAYRDAYKARDAKKTRALMEEQLELLSDMDALLSHRSELCLSRWLHDANALAENEREREYFELNARTLITIWGDYYSDHPHLFDYAWREWSGMIGGYYKKRWQMFYEECQKHLENKTPFFFIKGNSYPGRLAARKFKFGRKLGEFETKWCLLRSNEKTPADSDVVPDARALIKKWSIGGKSRS